MRRLIRWAQPIVLGLALIFILLLLRSQWEELRAYEWQIHGGWLLFSGIVLVASWFIDVVIWRTVLGWVGGQIQYREATRIWFASILVRYIPGNVWQPLGMTVLGQQIGVRPEATIASIVLFQAISLLSVVPLVAIYLLTGGTITVLALYAVAPWLALIAAAPVIVFLVRPGWLMSLLNWILVRLHRKPLAVRISSARLLLLLGIALLAWLLWGVAFVALTLSLRPLHWDTLQPILLTLLVAYPIAYAVGYLSFLTPGGLAVREGMLAILLIPAIGGLATVAALVMRLWLVILEVIVAGIVALSTRQRTGAEIGSTKAHEGTRRI
ncbi:MAG: flippase-like domain-containing protein [Caldilineaceae bacterium]|nr:flippase-like domain-containing protein [Caldilineaceae bacterium]